MKPVAIPMLVGLCGLVTSSGACKADEGSVDTTKLLGVWNMVQQTYVEYGEVYTYALPQLAQGEIDGSTYCAGYGYDLEFRAGGVANFITIEQYGDCTDELDSYSQAFEWEDLGDGTVGIFGEGFVGTTGYGYGSDGYTSEGTEDDSGGVPMRELFLVCTPGANKVDCSPAPVDTSSYNLTFGKPECSSTAQCGDAQVCFAQQCIVPTLYSGHRLPDVNEGNRAFARKLRARRTRR